MDSEAVICNRGGKGIDARRRSSLKKEEFPFLNTYRHMSESENPSSTPKTSAVPLKKETVRITLRARPGAGVTQAREATAPVSPSTSSVSPSSPKASTAPIQLPSAPLPPPAPKSATAPVKLPTPPLSPPSKKTTSAIPVVAAPAPSAPAPAPMPPPARPAGAPPVAPRPPGAPPVPTASLPAATRPLAKAPGAPGAPAAPRVEAGAATVPLAGGAPKPMAPKPPGGAGTGPMAGGAAPLPKATVKLQPTQAMQRPPISAPPSAPVKRSAQADSEQFYEEADPEAGLMPLAAVAFILAAALLVIQMLGADSVTKDVAGGTSPIMVPEAGKQKWETRSVSTGVWTNNFNNEIKSIP